MLYGWTGQTIERGRDHCERPGPVGLEKFDTKTSRGPQHFAGPPKNETHITQNKKIRQCVFAVCPGNDSEAFRKRSSPAKNKCKNPLALRKSYDIFHPIRIPHFSGRREFEQGLCGEGRESNSGGRAAWASFF